MQKLALSSAQNHIKPALACHFRSPPETFRAREAAEQEARKAQETAEQKARNLAGSSTLRSTTARQILARIDSASPEGILSCLHAGQVRSSVLYTALRPRRTGVTQIKDSFQAISALPSTARIRKTLRCIMRCLTVRRA